MRTLEPIRHHFINASLIVASISLAIICFRWSAADITNYQIDYFLDTAFLKSLSGTDADVDVWQKKRRQLEDTLRSRPDSSVYYANAERFYQKLDTLESLTPALIKKLGWKDNEQKALDYARTALQIRPSSAFLWKQVTLSDLALKQYGNELNGAFERAVSLDGWNKELLFKIIRLGLENWENIDDSAKQSVMLAMEHFLIIDDQLIMLHDGNSTINAKLILTTLNAAKACTTNNQLKAKLPKFDAFCKDFVHS